MWALAHEIKTVLSDSCPLTTIKQPKKVRKVYVVYSMTCNVMLKDVLDKWHENSISTEAAHLSNL